MLPPIPIYGAISSCLILHVHFVALIEPMSREVKFGALIQRMIPQDTWIATGKPCNARSDPFISISPRSLRTEILDYDGLGFPASTSSPFGSFEGPNILSLFHSRS